MKQFKKLIACVLAATLVLGSTTVVFGADNSQTGSLGGEATLEGTVNREVFSVEAPTIEVTGGVYDFKLDPEGLIEITSGGKYTSDGIYFLTPGSMYFQVSDTAYDVNSQKATLTNKSSVDVTVTLNATVTVNTASNAAITFDEDGVWATTDTSLGIYLAIKGEDQNSNEVTGAAIVANGGEFKGAVTTDLASYDAYSVQVSNGNYVYAIDSTKDATAATYTFWLTGACNTNAKWSDYDTNANPTIELVWTVKVKGTEGGSQGGVAVTSVNNGTHNVTYSKSSGLTVPYTLAEGVTITGITASNNASSITNDFSANVTTTGGNIKIASGQWAGAANGQIRYVKITFSTGDPVILTMTLAN